MSGIRCMGGRTQILRVLKHLKSEAAAGKVNACVYIGDAMEEPVDHLAAVAGEIGLMGVPVFMFQEGGDPQAVLGSSVGTLAARLELGPEDLLDDAPATVAPGDIRDAPVTVQRL